jgi:hypothetical protein
MKSTWTMAAAAAATLCAWSAPAYAGQPKTYALIVANNGSVDEGVAPLRYADDDGARYYETFSSLADEVRLLTVLDADSQRVFPKVAPKTLPPTRRQLAATVAELAAAVARDRAAGERPQVYLVFTGHGNVDASGEGYLSLSDGKLRRSELYREVLRPLEGASTHLIIDACHAYFMVRSRGGPQDDRSGQTLDDELDAYLTRSAGESSGLPSTVGVILSTSGTAEVHEWSKLRAGVFSHQLRSGLLGAADVDGDGAVGYLELEAFLAAANAGVTNPKARISVYAQAPAQDLSTPLVRLSDFDDAATLELPEGVRGRFHVEDARGVRYADMNVDGSRPTTLALLRAPTGGGAYYLRDAERQARIDTSPARVDAGALAFAERDSSSRGSVEEAFRTSLFATPFGPGFYGGYVASRRRYEVMLAERGAGLEARAERGFTPNLTLEYGAGNAALDLSGVQHSGHLSVPFTHTNGFTVGPFLGYGFTPGQGESAHRVALGAELGWRLQAGEGWAVTPRLRIGNQLFLQTNCGDDVELCADPIGLRASLGAAVATPLAGGAVYLHGDGALDVATQANAQRSVEQTFWTFSAGAGVRF